MYSEGPIQLSVNMDDHFVGMLLIGIIFPSDLYQGFLWHLSIDMIAAEWMYHPYHFEMYQS